MKELGLSTFINHRMVIQREKPFPLWSCKKIAVNFLEKTYEAKSVDGRWLVSLDPAQAGGPFSMNIASENESFEITDIYIGDVWLCAGQSNMEMQMQRLKDDFSEEWQLNEYPLVRQFKVPQEWDFSAPSEDLTGGNWLSASAETLHEFSGTAWFFARKMYEKYRIPIGLVNTAWGGTPVEAWMSRGALAPWVEKIAAGDQYADAAKREAVAKESEQAINVWNNALNASDIGLAQNWKNGDWEKTGGTMSLPGDFAEAGLKSFCGVLWLKKEFVINENLNDNYINEEYKVWLGTITDADTVYINGVEIGNTGYRYPPRKYSIPHGVLQKGKNTIIIRVICNNGEGGVTIEKDFRVFSGSESVELAGEWDYRVGAKVTSACPEQFFFQRQPMGNYNAMISPVLKFPLKGVIWYQGESNEQNPHEYAALFQAMIKDWRGKNKNEALPFLFVQLPIWKEETDNNENDSWALLREAQAAALSLPHTGMAAALELGEWNDLHPLNKKDVGIRLFLAADKVVFNCENTSPGPQVRAWEKRQDKLYILFDNCGSGLKSACGKTFVSLIDGDEMQRVPAEIEGSDLISIDISTAKNVKKVLYAWAINPKDRQLYNSDGLPAIPFKIEID